MSRVSLAIAGLLFCLATRSWAGPSDPASSQSDTMDNAVAGVVIDALSTLLGGVAIDMHLDQMQVQPTNDAAMRIVTGRGSLQVDGGGEPIGFRFTVPYDERLGGAGVAEVELGGVNGNERDLPNDAQLVQQLQDQITSALQRDYHEPDPRLQMRQISTVEAGQHYLRIDIDASAHLGTDDDAPTRIRALYDRVASRWVRVHYDVGSNPAQPLDAPLATR